MLYGQRILHQVLDPECLFGSLTIGDSEDSDIWDYAKTHNYSIVTFDSDYYVSV